VNRFMLKHLALCLCLLPVPAGAADWTFEGGTTPIAYADNEDAQFQFACRGRDLTMAYWVRKPDATVAAAPSMSLAMNATGGSVSAASDTGFAQDFPMIHHDGSSVLIRGPVARQWARNAQQARDSIELAFVETETNGGMEFRDRQRFGAKGSSAAIAKVLADCR
jgi:hypothetical protein